MSKTEPSGLRSMENKHKQLTILRCKVVVVGTMFFMNNIYVILKVSSRYFTYICLFCILGDCCVGKTALTQVFQSGGSTYPKNYLMVVFSFVSSLNCVSIMKIFIFLDHKRGVFCETSANSGYQYYCGDLYI